MSESITWQASLPPIKSAILLDGNGDGGQVKFDVDMQNVGALLLLQQNCAGKVITLTATWDDDDRAT